MTQNALIVTSIRIDVNTIPIEEARLIAQQLLQEALLRLDIANERGLEICDNIIGLLLRC